MMRIVLFLATNAAVLVLVSIVFQVLGIEGILAQNGVDLNLQALLVMSAVIGFGGSFISLAMSKFIAKRSMGVQVIDKPRNARRPGWTDISPKNCETSSTPPDRRAKWSASAGS